MLDADKPCIFAGDYNVAPTDEDYEPGALPPTDALVRPETRAAFRAMVWLGLTDAVRALKPRGKVYTFWDYQAGAWRRGFRVADRSRVAVAGVGGAAGERCARSGGAGNGAAFGPCAGDVRDRAVRDALGWRHRFGVLGPSTNTVVQPDLEGMRPAGVTNHYSRIFTPNADAVSNDSFMAGAKLIGENTIDAVQSVMTSSPDSLVMGMSAVTFFGGMAGADAFQARIEQASGVKVSVGSHATAAALRAYGGVKRVAFMSPYFPAANAEVRRYLTEAGFEVVRDRCLQCPSWTAIAAIPTADDPGFVPGAGWGRRGCDRAGGDQSQRPCGYARRRSCGWASR